MKTFPWNSLVDFVTTFFRLGLGISIQFHSEAWLWLSDLFGAHFLQINCWIFVVLRRNTFFQTFLELVSELDLCFPIIRFSSNALKLSWLHFFFKLFPTKTDHNGVLLEMSKVSQALKLSHIEIVVDFRWKSERRKKKFC